MLLHDVIQCLSVNLVYIKLWGLAMKIRFCSKTCMIQKGTWGTAPEKLTKVSWKRLEQKLTVIQRNVHQRQIHSVDFFAPAHVTLGLFSNLAAYPVLTLVLLAVIPHGRL